MTYQETINYLFTSAPLFQNVGGDAYKEGLYNTYQLDNHFGHPHQHYKTIHVAGTNGKGSCSHTMAAILQASGFKVGLFTSPHLVDFRERIRVNGEMISEQYVIDFVEQHRAFFEPLHPSFFELTTAMAFKYFAEQHVDVAVIEVGLGGRLDCTNIITPMLSVITNISLDHTDMLGDTLAKIAGEKAGIIKEGVPVVIGETTPETKPVFEAKAREQHAPITFADETTLVEMKDGHYTTVDGITFEGDLKGIYQLKNTNTVLHALNQLLALGILKEVNYDVFNHVAENTGLMARWQKMGDQPLVVCDTGHNVGGWEYLSRQIASVTCQKRHIVFGMVSDKDVNTVMTMLPKDAKYYFTQAPTHRAIPADHLVEKGKTLGLTGDAYPTVTEAVNAALHAATPSDFVFIGGSTYVVAEYLKTTI